jgi:hypothetical protein
MAVGLPCGREKPTSILRREETLALCFFFSFSGILSLVSRVSIPFCFVFVVFFFCGHES